MTLYNLALLKCIYYFLSNYTLKSTKITHLLILHIPYYLAFIPPLFTLNEKPVRKRDTAYKKYPYLHT